MGTGKWNFPRPCWLFFVSPCIRKVLPVTSPADYRENIIKLNILMIEYIKQTCYNAITSKKHSLFTIILYREIRLPKLLTADIFIPNW